MIEFAGYALPVQFQGVIPEHLAVRNSVGVFDVSHMGRFEVRGRDALDFVNYVTTNDVQACAPGQAQYSVFCYPDGGIVDDLLVYNLGDYLLLVVNGANRAKDFEWLQQNRRGDVVLSDVTDSIAQLAVQGPKSEAVMQQLVDIPLSPLRFYWSAWCTICGQRALISRTGYTGEDGFEIYFPAEAAHQVWDAVLDAGKSFDIQPAGLGARDTLRLEMKYALYGNDIDETTNPLEAQLGFVTKLEKAGVFIGCEALRRIKAEGVKRKLVGFETSAQHIPRPHYELYREGKKVGYVTSGTLSPSLRVGIGMGYVAVPNTGVGTALEIDIRGRRAPAVIVATPFYKHGTRK